MTKVTLWKEQFVYRNYIWVKRKDEDKHVIVSSLSQLNENKFTF